MYNTINTDQTKFHFKILIIAVFYNHKYNNNYYNNNIAKYERKNDYWFPYAIPTNVNKI